MNLNLQDLHKRESFRMRPMVFAIIAAGVATLVLTAGCGKSLQQRIEEAKGSASEEQQAGEAGEKAEQAAREDYLDEWQDFRGAAENQIAANTKTMDSLKGKAAAYADDKLRNGVSATLEELAKKNKELNQRLQGYKDEGKLSWDAFKRDFSHDLNGLDKTLRDLGAADKK
jgi:hypothetical protein